MTPNLNYIARKLRTEGFSFHQTIFPPIGSIVQDYERKGKNLRGVVWTNVYRDAMIDGKHHIILQVEPAVVEDGYEQQSALAEEISNIIGSTGLRVWTIRLDGAAYLRVGEP